MFTDEELPPIDATFGEEESSIIQPIDPSNVGLFLNVLSKQSSAAARGISSLASFMKTFVDIADSTVDLAKFGTVMSTPEGLPNYIAKRIVAAQQGVSYEDFEETESNTIGLTALSRVLDKAIIKPPVDKKTGKPLDYVDLFERGEYGKVPGAFVQEVAGAAPSMIISRIPGGYALLGATSFIDSFNRDLVERPDQDPGNVLLKSIVYGTADAIGEYFGGRFLNRLGGSFVKGSTDKVLIDKAKDSIIGGVGAIVKTTLKGGSFEFAQEAITAVVQEAGEEIIYGDEKTKAGYFRKALHAGLIGFALGGTSGTISAKMDQKNRRKFYEIVTNKSYKRKMVNLYKQEEEALEDLENASNDQKKVFQKIVDDIRQQRKDLQNEMYNKFDAYSESKWKEHFKNLDIQQQQLDIITGGRKYSNSAKERAKKLFLKAAKDNELAFNSDVDIKDLTAALESGKAARLAEKIRERRNNLFFKAKDLKYEFIDNQEQFDKLKKDFGDDIANSTSGFFETNEGKIYINQAVAAVNESANVIGHELFHYAISNRFANDPKAMRGSIIAFRDYIKQLKDGEYILKQLDKKFIDGDYAKLDARGEVQYDKDGLVVMKREQDIEEYFTQFSDLIDNEQIESVEEASQGIKNSFRTLARGLGIGANKIDFKSGQEVFELLIDYNRNINRSGVAGAITQFGAIRSVSGKSKRRIARGIFSSKAQAKENLEKYAKDEKGDFKKELYDPNSEIIAKELPGMVKAQVDNYFNNRTSLKVTSDQRGRQLRNEMISDVLLRLYDVSEKTGKSDVNSFDGRGSLYGYLNGRIKFRMLDHFESSSSVVPDFTTQQLDEAKADLKQETVEQEQKEVKTERKKIVLAERLGITKQVAEAINKIVPNLDIDKLTFKTLKNEIPEITGDLFGIATKKIETLANITKKELQSAQMFINKNADLLIAMLPEGVTASGTATGVPRTLLNEFYTKGERVKAAKTGSRAGLAVQQKNSNITKKQFLQVFGIVDGKPMRDDRNTSARVLALANLTGKMITNQAVRQELAKIDDSTANAINKIKDGKSDIMFAKKTIRAKSPFKKAPTNKSSKDRVMYKNALRFFYEEIPLPVVRGKSILHKGTFARGTSKSNDVVVDNYYMSATEADTLAIEIFNDQLKRSTLFTKEQVNLITEVFRSKLNDFNKLGKNLELLKKGVTYYLNRWNTLINVQKQQKFLLTFEKLLESSSVAKSHLMRMMAPALGATNVDVIAEREHVLVQNVAGEIIFDSLVSDNLSLVLPWFIENYYMVGLNKNQNALLKDYSKVMPDVFYENLKKAIEAKDMSLASDPLIRYTMSNLNLTEINWHTGGNLLQHIDAKYGFNGELTYGNNSDTSIEKINNVLTKFFGKEINKKQALQQIKAIKNVKYSKGLKTISEVGPAQANTSSLKFSKTSRGMSTFDFDETLIDKGKNIIIAEKDGDIVEISSADWPLVGDTYKQDGYNFNFDDFINIRGGVEGPLLQKMRNQISKFGPDNVFVLTARPPQSAKAIHDWLKSKDINIPLKNITGLGNSTGEAKAMWMLKKFEEGYNDMYFDDDALPNVKAVKDVLDQLDIKSDVQQVNIKFSKNGSKDFNKILEEVKNVNRSKKFGEKTAARMGATKGRFKFFVPPTHEDFIGLIYNFIGKGEAGNRHRKFFEDNLIKPLNRAFVNLNKARQAISNDYVNLLKQSPNVKKLLNKKVPGTEYFYSDAVRIYLWNKFNFNIPGLLESEIKELVEVVTSNGELQVFADNIGLISRQANGYIEPNENWQVGDIRTDLQDATGRVGRAQFFNRFFENADVIFSKETLNKIEALYGTNLRESIQHMLDSIKTGTTRNPGDKRTNQFLDYINGSVGATMFFNIRSMLLQQLSNINFINWGDNNVFKAAAAFANQKQYWNDFALLFNSDFLKQRRSGIAFDVNGNELAKEISKSKQPFRATVRFLLQKGFTPTQFGDSLAIAMGGATMYRNRVKTYLKQGLSKAEAEKKAFEDFVEVAEATQQSARVDMIGMQQKLPIGKILLAFQNYGSQVVRIKKKAVLDLVNRRITPPYKTQKGSDMANVSKIIHYAVVQNVLFHGLQTAIFALAFSDDDEDRELLKTKTGRFYNGMVDTILRGTGIAGGVVSVLKNTAIAWVDEQEKPSWKRDKFITFKELLKISPPLSIKERKISQADNTRAWNEKVIKEMPLTDIDNPVWPMIFKYIEGITNLPIDNAYQNYQNLKAASDSEITWWKRLALLAGWSRWDVGVENKEIEAVKKEIKQRNKRGKKNTGFGSKKNLPSL